MSDLFNKPPTRGDFPCPWCGEKNDAAISTREPGAVPRPGDVALCMTCAKPSVYQEHGKPRRPTESEWAVLNADPHITKIRKGIFMSNRGNVCYRDLEVRVTDDGQAEAS
jgi:hypothetical protein